MVLEIAAAAEAEIDRAADEAYAEGYKAASLRFAPEIEALKTQLKMRTVSKTAVVKDRVLFSFGGFALGVLSVGIYNLIPK
jgi:hypothetical protein